MITSEPAPSATVTDSSIRIPFRHFDKSRDWYYV